MSDQALGEITKYGLLNNEQDEELNELVEIVSILCDVPIALITLTDGDSQYFVARKGLEMESVSLEDSFCKNTLASDKPVFTVKNALDHDYFKTNKYVVGEPNVRFYAGSPLITPSGIKIGTICLLDKKERSLPLEKMNIIELTAKRVVKVLERRKQLMAQGKQIEVDQQRLRYLTDNAPGALFQLDYHHGENRYEFSFVSAGISRLHPALSPMHLKADPYLLSDLIHEDDKEPFQNSIVGAIRDFQPWHKEFRLITNEGGTWIRGVAVPRKHENTTEWYGLFENI
ncbi:MAG: GAF domain-containing protein, partial [Cryomorphaceae bacterium]